MLATACSNEPESEPTDRPSKVKDSSKLLSSDQKNEQQSSPLNIDERIDDAFATEEIVAILVQVKTPKPKIKVGQSGKPASIESGETGEDHFDEAISYFSTTEWTSSTPIFVRNAGIVSMRVSRNKYYKIRKLDFIEGIVLNSSYK